MLKRQYHMAKAPAVHQRRSTNSAERKHIAATCGPTVKELRGRIVLLTRMKKIKIIEMPAIIEFYS